MNWYKVFVWSDTLS